MTVGEDMSVFHRASSPPPPPHRHRLLNSTGCSMESGSSPTPSAVATSILSATLTARSTASLLAASNNAKGKLGFSIDSIVGINSNSSSNTSDSSIIRGGWPIRTVTNSSSSPPPRDRSPLYRPASSPPVSPPPSAADYTNGGRRSSSPNSLHHNRSSDSSPPPPVSPPLPSQRCLVRPIPTTTNGGGVSSFLGSPQSYLDQLASLKAFYESTASRGGPPNNSAMGGGGPPLMHPGLLPPGLHPMLSGLQQQQRPPGGLPAFLGGPPSHHHHPVLPPHLPREYPLYPWFIHRHRFPGGTEFDSVGDHWYYNISVLYLNLSYYKQIKILFKINIK